MADRRLQLSRHALRVRRELRDQKGGELAADAPLRQEQRAEELLDGLRLLGLRRRVGAREEGEESYSSR